MNATPTDAQGRPLINMDQLVPFAANLAIKTAKQIDPAMSELLEHTLESRKALETAVQGIGESIERLKPVKGEMISELRSLRMVATTELAATMKPLEDIRKFFLGESHSEEVNRLREFVDLCERLQKLKESGFLDTVADTMLRLA